DIGGPTMLRAAAKNHTCVTLAVDPADYDQVLADMRANDGAVSAALRQQLAAKGFDHSAAYDRAIADYFAADSTTTDAGGRPALPTHHEPRPRKHLAPPSREN